MNYREYIEESVKEINPDLRKVFNKALTEVFSQRYLMLITNKLKDYLIIKEVDYENENVVAYNVGTKIFINRSQFWKYDEKKQVRYLLHEFIHILQRKRGFIFSKFPEIRKLSKKLYVIVEKHSSQPVSVFLTGKNQDLGPGRKWEVLSYFMNNSIDWRAISEQGKALLVSEIKNSGIFNTSTAFWKRRLPY